MVRQSSMCLDLLDYDRWNNFVRMSPWGHLMQSWEWGVFKASLGWRVRRVAIESAGEIIAGAQILFKAPFHLPLTIAYIPKGPVVDLKDAETTDLLFSAIHQAARAERAIFLKIEPNMLDNSSAHTVLRQLGFNPVDQTNQPRSTLVLSLSDSENAMLLGMRKTTRKLIRRAVREGVEVVAGEEEDLDAFYQILLTTADLKEIPVHKKVFYQKAWEAFRPTQQAKLLLAKYQGQVVGTKIICVFKDRSMHLWGGVSPLGRDSYASYLMQWEAMKWARQQAYDYCDLWGIPDEVGALLKAGQEIPKDRHDGLWGVYTFKRGFGGQVEYYLGAYDYVYKPWLYTLGMKLVAQGHSVDEISNWIERFSGRRRAI